MKTYYLKPFCKYYFLIPPIILFWSIIGLIIFFSEQVYNVLPIIFIGIVGTIINVRNANTTRIVVFKKGIKWYRSGFIYWTRWEYIAKISHRFYGLSIQEGFVVNKLMIHFRKWGIGNITSPWNILFLKSRPFIPLSCFSNNWHTSELGQQIKEYAPHLFK